MAARRRCRCGALTEPGRGLCRKCRARARWHRRKASRSPRRTLPAAKYGPPPFNGSYRR